MSTCLARTTPSTNLATWSAYRSEPDSAAPDTLIAGRLGAGIQMAMPPASPQKTPRAPRTTRGTGESKHDRYERVSETIFRIHSDHDFSDVTFLLEGGLRLR